MSSGAGPVHPAGMRKPAAGAAAGKANMDIQDGQDFKPLVLIYGITTKDTKFGTDKDTKLIHNHKKILSH